MFDEDGEQNQNQQQIKVGRESTQKHAPCSVTTSHAITILTIDHHHHHQHHSRTLWAPRAHKKRDEGERGRDGGGGGGRYTSRSPTKTARWQTTNQTRNTTRKNKRKEEWVVRNGSRDGRAPSRGLCLCFMLLVSQVVIWLQLSLIHQHQPQLHHHYPPLANSSSD